MKIPSLYSLRVWVGVAACILLLASPAVAQEVHRSAESVPVTPDPAAVPATAPDSYPPSVPSAPEAPPPPQPRNIKLIAAGGTLLGIGMLGATMGIGMLGAGLFDSGTDIFHIQDSGAVLLAGSVVLFIVPGAVMIGLGRRKPKPVAP